MRHTRRPISVVGGWLGRRAWLWLALLLMAPAVVTALGQDIGAHAYDAATEHIARGVVFSQAISDGILYPRWTQTLHWGLGSPLFTFQPPLPYYGLDLLYRLGLSHPLGWRLLVALGFGAAFVGAFLLVREITGRRWPAIVAATAFLYAPYVLRNTLVRGSNEMYSLFLYPLVLWSLLWVAKRPSIARILCATLVWAACIASHVLGPLMLAPYAAGLALYLAWRFHTGAALATLLVGGLLTAGIWAPMGPEQHWVHVERDFEQPEAIPARNPLPLERLLAPPTVYDTQRDDNGTGVGVGVVHTALLPLGLIVASFAWRARRRWRGLMAAAFIGLGVFWLLTAASDPVWQATAPILGRLLYRTRLMGLLALASATAGGLLVAVISPRWQARVGGAMTGLFLLLALPSLYVDLQHRYAEFRLPVDLAQVRAVEIRGHGSALTAYGEFTPRWRVAPFDTTLLSELGAPFDAARQPLVAPPAGVQLLASAVRSTDWELELSAVEPVTLTLHLLYYPRWAATVDGAHTLLFPEEKTGYTQLRFPAGTHRLHLDYASTPVEQAGLAISAAVFIGLLIAPLWASLRVRRRAASTAGEVLQPAMSRTDGLAQEDGESAPPISVLLVLSVLLAMKFAVIDPATTWLRCVSTATQVCGAQAAASVHFPGAPSLAGYTRTPDVVRPGDALRVDLFWRGAAGVTTPLRSFVHVRNSKPNGVMNPRTGDELWAQDEHSAWSSLLATEFVPDKLYKDEFRLVLPADMPEGEYLVEIGWFDPHTGEQLDPQSNTVKAPLRVLWRSILLPSVRLGAE